VRRRRPGIAADFPECRLCGLKERSVALHTEVIGIFHDCVLYRASMVENVVIHHSSLHEQKNRLAADVCFIDWILSAYFSRDIPKENAPVERSGGVEHRRSVGGTQGGEGHRGRASVYMVGTDSHRLCLYGRKSGKFNLARQLAESRIAAR